MSAISGILIFASFIISIYSYFYNTSILIFAGIFAWYAFFILFSSLYNKKLVLVLCILSFITLLVSFYNEYKIDLIKLFTVNQFLLTLLIGVGFLRLISTPKKENMKNLPIGKSSFIKTYIGVHLFGSVINMSSLLLVADKLYKKAKLTNSQIIVLTRAFSSDAYWSPFFVAFAAALTYAPNLDTHLILFNGLLLAFIGFLITYIEITKNKDLDLENFKGYPISLDNLVLPFSLAFLVLLTNYFYEDIKVIVLIALFSILLTFIVLPIKKGFKNSCEIFKIHILE